MKCVAIILYRLALAIWVGGAILFVITSIAEQTSPHFDSTTRDLLASVRFPHYYRFGACCLGTAAVFAIAAVLKSNSRERRRHGLVFVMTLLSIAIAAGDYEWVYKPLQAEIIPPGQPRSARFDELHQRSRLVNEIHVGLALLAAVISMVSHRPETVD